MGSFVRAALRSVGSARVDGICRLRGPFDGSREEAAKFAAHFGGVTVDAAALVGPWSWAGDRPRGWDVCAFVCLAPCVGKHEIKRHMTHTDLTQRALFHTEASCSRRRGLARQSPVPMGLGGSCTSVAAGPLSVTCVWSQGLAWPDEA